MGLEALSSPVVVTKMKVDELEVKIRSKGQIPLKGPKAVQVYQLNKLLDVDIFPPLLPQVQMEYYNN